MLSLEEMKANRRKWVKALRSGRYKQAKDGLAYDDGAYCCLGVLARCAGVKRDDLLGHATLSHFWQAMNFVGLRTDIGEYGQTALSSLNDGGATFGEIADIVESEPKGLFVESVR